MRSSMRRKESPAPTPTVRQTTLAFALALAVALTLALSTSAQTAAAQVNSTYYVSTKGSDSNSGTMSSPWQTIQHAANSVSAGATVYVFGGVYHEAVNFPASGTASAPITFQSYPGQTAVIDGTGVKCCGSSGTEGLVTIVNQSYVVVSGF